MTAAQSQADVPEALAVRVEDRLMAAATICDAATPDLPGIDGIDYLGAHAGDALTAYPVMAGRCADCAFTPSTSANLTPTTFIAARECVERSHPFFCHKGEDALGDKTHLCAGWMRAIVARAALIRTGAK